MLRGKSETEIWGYIHTDDKVILINHWENLLGRARSADLSLPFSSVSRVHAVLVRNNRGLWRIYDVFSKGGVWVNGDRVRAAGLQVCDGDVIRLADNSMRFRDITEQQRKAIEARRKRPWKKVHPALTLLDLTLFQTVLLLEHLLSAEPEHMASVAMGYGLLALLEWACYFFMRGLHRTGFEVETIAFFLSSLGLSVIASSVPEEIIKQMIFVSVGVALYFTVGWWLSNIDRTKTARGFVGAVALALLALNIVAGEVKNGAANWLTIAGISLQPSELIKVAYIYVGAATLERLFRTKNLIKFIAFSAVCVMGLALISDFGAALIFFATFLVISFMRSGSVATVALSVTGAGMAGFLVLRLKSHVADRFASWGHAWEPEFVFAGGNQQARAMSAAASGGLFGKGAGRGWLKGDFAANTDTVFALISEELGLIIAVCAVLFILALTFFTVRNCAQGRSAYYSIAACATASMFMIQMALNVFGSVDILPFTGVTFPFVSRGGTSLLSCWMLLAFIKAGDTRKGASFIVRPADRIKEAPKA